MKSYEDGLRQALKILTKRIHLAIHSTLLERHAEALERTLGIQIGLCLEASVLNERGGLGVFYFLDL